MHWERVLVLFHERLDHPDFFVGVERQNQHVLLVFHLLAKLLHVRRFQTARAAPRRPQSEADLVVGIYQLRL
jgi:hypothetical protein